MSNSDAKSRKQSDRHLWVVQLRRLPRGGHELDSAMATASELMFFWSAPLAHVIAYEDRLRARRREQELQARKRRSNSLQKHRLRSLDMTG